MKVTRRGFVIASLAGVSAVSGYGRWLESGWLEVTHRRITLKNQTLQRPIRILHLSDLHADSAETFALADESFSLGLEQNPDLVCLTGDYLTRGRLLERTHYIHLLRRLSRSVPVFASFGNHDGGDWSASEGGEKQVNAMRRTLEEAGIRCLHNESVVVTLGDQSLNLAGLGDLWACEAFADRAFAGIDARELPTIVLTHNPDTFEMLRPFRWDVALAGHTHGGQIVVPILGIAPYIPVSDRRFLRGLHEFDQRHVFVTRGVGSILGIRFNCRPEVSVLDLVPA